jgi:hypothetical protein
MELVSMAQQIMGSMSENGHLAGQRETTPSAD